MRNEPLVEIMQVKDFRDIALTNDEWADCSWS